MQSVCLKDFFQYFPYVPQDYAQRVYTQPFRGQDILRCFEGWDYYEYGGCYIDHSEDRNIVRFESTGYTINAQKFRSPVNLNDFISDCREAGVRLLWSEEMAAKLWFKPPFNRKN